MERFWYAFIPLFVALDAVGLLPVYQGLVRRLNGAQRLRAATDAVVTALGVSIGFLLVSRVVFRLMGLELADIMVAGGVILIVLCLRELLLPEKPGDADTLNPGVVPIGVPLLAGPAVFTTVLLVRDQYGWEVTLAALAANLAVVWLLLRTSEALFQRLGREGSQVISKISNLILTAFGVMLIRQGISAFARLP